MSLLCVRVRLDRHWPELPAGINVWESGLVVCRFPLKLSNQWTKTSHLWSKAQCISADDRHNIDLTDWAFLLVGAVKSCSLTLWPLCPNGSPVIGHFACALLNSRMWASSPTSCWTGWRTPSRWRLKKTGNHSSLYPEATVERMDVQ